MLAQSRSEDFHWERRLAAGQRVRAININGDITVTPSPSGRVEIIGIKRGSSRDFDRIRADGGDATYVTGETLGVSGGLGMV